VIRASLILFAIFFDLATTILICIAIALIWPGTPFDVVWLLQPEREAMLMPYHLLLGPLFLVLAIPGACAVYGFITRQSWARELAIAIFVANGVGNAMQIAFGHPLEGLIGATIAAALVFYLTRDAVRSEFLGDTQTNPV